MKDKQKTMINKNEKKAMEFAKDRGHDGQSITEAFVACLDMAEWKDKQFKKENKWISVKDKLPPLFPTVVGDIQRSNPVLGKDNHGHYCVVICVHCLGEPCFWQDDNYVERNVKFWKEIKD